MDLKIIEVVLEIKYKLDFEEKFYAHLICIEGELRKSHV